MSRYTKQIDNNISIAYGFDFQLQDYFVQVYDSRLAFDESKSEQDNFIADLVDQSGEGEIASFDTTGRLISKATTNRSFIVELLSKFDVREDHIKCVALDLPIE